MQIGQGFYISAGKIDAFQKQLAGLGFENCVVHMADIGFRKIAFLGVYEIVGLD